MKPTVPRLAIALAALIAFPLAAGETKGKTAEKPAAPAAEAAVKIHVDPATGQIVSPKSDPDAARGVSATSTAQPLPPLRVEKVTTKAGGRKVNLQGRYRMEMAATVSPDGKVAGTCDTPREPGSKAAATEHSHDR
ncbi:MAG: hypothetical protein IPP07_16230 [Holophagales bacterium]|nr:hypothetical protein [Holophagales bacterium]